MTKYVYLTEREKYELRGGDWVATQKNSAWSTAIYTDYRRAKDCVIRDYDYMFGVWAKTQEFKFMRPCSVDVLDEEKVVASIVVTYDYCGSKCKVVYRITKKQLIQ